MLKPFRILSEDELLKLSLISKSRNSPYSPIYKEELPKVLYGNSPRQLLGKNWFNWYTTSLAGIKTCQGCGSTFNGVGERHEFYGLYFLDLPDFKEYVIKLEGVMKLCSSCHRKIHKGFSTRLGMRAGFLPDVAPESDSYKIGPWGKAKFILVVNRLFSL